MSRLSHMSRANFDTKYTDKFNAGYNDRAQTANVINLINKLK